MIAPADKAVLRLAIGLGLAVLVAYGLALPLPYVVCLMAVMVLCKPGPPMPPVKGGHRPAALPALVTGRADGPPAGELCAGRRRADRRVLYALFFFGIRTGNPLTMILVVAFTLIPVAGVAEQALVTIISVTLAVGSRSAAWSAAFRTPSFPTRPGRPRRRQGAAPQPRDGELDCAARHAGGDAGVHPGADRPLVLPGGDHETAALGQQAGSTDTRSAGRELVGSTLMGAGWRSSGSACRSGRACGC
jgi:hypothetical protein